MKYTHLVQFENAEFEVETATTVEEAKELLRVGFDLIPEKATSCCLGDLRDLRTLDLEASVKVYELELGFLPPDFDGFIP